MSTTVIVDGNSVGYTEHHGTRLNSGDLQTQSIFGFCHKARHLRIGYPGCDLLVLWDGRADWRFELHPPYKSNREDDPKKIEIKREYQKARPYISKALDCLGIKQVTVGTHEADDMAGYLTRKLTEASPDNRVVLLTTDHDWYQMVRPNVVVRNPKDPAFILKHSNFTDITGYRTPIAFLEGKALQGDVSDVIPGIPQLGEKTACEFLAEWGSVFNFFKAVDSGAYTPKTRASKTAKSLHPEQFLASPEGRRIFFRNLKLMQLLNVQKPNPHDVRVVKGALDVEKFSVLCEELAFMSILRDMDAFIEPF